MGGEHPEIRHGARDTTARAAALSELTAMQSRPSQFSPGQEVPEKNFFYRFAKKHFFNDFGAYTRTKKVNLKEDAGTKANAAELKVQ